MNAPVGQAEIGGTSRALIAVITDLVRELHGQGGRALDVSLSSRLDRDLGIDSLGRTELVLRIERVFRVRLPVGVMGEADTVADILSALEQAAPDTRGGVAVEAPIGTQPVAAASQALDFRDAERGAGNFWRVAGRPRPRPPPRHKTPVSFTTAGMISAL